MGKLLCRHLQGTRVHRVKLVCSALIGIKLGMAVERRWVGVNNSRFSDAKRTAGGKEMNRLS